MTEPNDHLADALHGLRGEIRDQVPLPAAARLRARATHRLRVRRVTTAVVAAAAVAAVAIGGGTLLRPTAGPPAPPADTPTPAPVTPSPRPAPRPVEPVDDPIAEVNWATATIDLPPQDGCPSGPVTFTSVSDIVPNASGPNGTYPAAAIDATGAAYGDVTGDGRAEAVLSAACLDSEEDSGDGKDQMLVVARESGGELRGIAWVGPRGAHYTGYWIADGALYAEIQPYLTEDIAWGPGMAWRYQWSGDGFGDPVAAPEYPSILPVGGGEAGPTVRLGAVAGGLGCPDRGLRFDHDGRAQVDTVSYELTTPKGVPHLVDLDRTGERLLVAAIACTRGDEVTSGLAVFRHAEDGFVGISVRTERYPPESWHPELVPGSELRLVVHLDPGNGASPRERTYRWTGTVLEPADD